MIYSKILQREIPTKIEKLKTNLNGFNQYTYMVKDGTMTVGHVDLRDTLKGVYVMFIENEAPDFYSHFGELADLISVKHCVNRGMDRFEIVSEAGLNSHVQHYKRGNRYFNEKVNEYIKNLITSNPTKKDFDTKFLGNEKMFMPKKIIEKYLNMLKEKSVV